MKKILMFFIFCSCVCFGEQYYLVKKSDLIELENAPHEKYSDRFSLQSSINTFVRNVKYKPADIYEVEISSKDWPSISYVKTNEFRYRWLGKKGWLSDWEIKSLIGGEEESEKMEKIIKGGK